jgi:hypothetical protein
LPHIEYRAVYVSRINLQRHRTRRIRRIDGLRHSVSNRHRLRAAVLRYGWRDKGERRDGGECETLRHNQCVPRNFIGV